MICVLLVLCTYVLYKKKTHMLEFSHAAFVHAASVPNINPGPLSFVRMKGEAVAIGEIDGDDCWAAGSMLIDMWRKGRMPSSHQYTLGPVTEVPSTLNPGSCIVP